MAALSSRIRAFDWLRGLAILFMIQCHAMVLLTEELRKSPLAKTLLWYDGLVAPAFIFTSGFSLALVQVRAARSGEARLPRAKKTARRIVEVFLVATLVNWMWFPIFREPKWILRFDILHCIALSLTLALPLVAVLARRPALLATVTVAVAFTLFGLAPYAEAVSGPLALLFSKLHSKTTFPLTPWAGYVFLGASAGAWAGTGNLKRLVFWMLGLTAVGLVLWRLQPFLFHGVYPPHQQWETNPGNHGQRWMWISLLVLTLLALELRAKGAWPRRPPVRFLEVFGGSSLAAYFFHQALLFYRLFGWGFSFNAWWKNSCGFPKYFALTAVVISATFVLCVITDRLYARADNGLSLKPAKKPAVAPIA